MLVDSPHSMEGLNGKFQLEVSQAARLILISPSESSLSGGFGVSPHLIPYTCVGCWVSVRLLASYWRQTGEQDTARLRPLEERARGQVSSGKTTQ
jgi:hypothetical protein